MMYICCDDIQYSKYQLDFVHNLMDDKVLHNLINEKVLHNLMDDKDLTYFNKSQNMMPHYYKHYNLLQANFKSLNTFIQGNR